MTDDKDSKDKSKNHARLTAASVKKDRKNWGEIPRVTASGQGAVAEKILKIAFEHGIKVRKDADLAEILAKIDEESEIPTEALLAVAEILAYIYETNRAQYEHLAPQTEKDTEKPDHHSSEKDT